MLYEKTEHKKRVRTRYSLIVADTTRDMGQLTCSEQNLDSLKRRFMKFQRMFVEMFDKHLGTSPHALRYHLLDHMLEDI